MKYLFRDNCVGVSIFRQAGAAPTITLVSVVDITDSTATANVSIADGDDVSKTGVEIDTDPLFSNPTAYEDNGAVNSIAIDNLTAETTYYVRGYVIWNGQTIYSSNSLNFTTESSSILPAELQGCEYLQTDGNSYIKLNYYANNITNFYIKTSNDGNTSGTVIFGASPNAANNLRLLRSINGNYLATFFANTNTNYESIVGYGNLLEFYFDKINQYCDFNSERINITNTYSTVGNGQIYLFGGNVNGVFYNNLTKARIYRVEVSGKSIYPCYVKFGETFIDNKGNTCSAGTAGMYDVVNNVFYTNDGTGTFSKGADINI